MVFNVTKTEKEVLGYLIRDSLTIRKIANLRGTSIRAVYKTLASLKKKGLVSGTQLKGFTNQGSRPKPNLSKSNGNLIRLHDVSFKIKILTSSKFYETLRNNKNIHYVDNNTVKLYRETLIIYLCKDFISDDPTRSSANMLNYFNRVLLMLENELGLILIRKRYTTVKLLSSHYAEINNELAEEYNEKKLKLNIYAKEDGKLWFQIDNSFNLNEAETLHPQTSELDMIQVKAHFNDIRDNSPPLPSEQYKLTVGLIKVQQTTTHQLELLTSKINDLVDFIIKREVN